MKDCVISKYEHDVVIAICMRKMIVNIISKMIYKMIVVIEIMIFPHLSPLMTFSLVAHSSNCLTITTPHPCQVMIYGQT